jgi:hypothetical protein
VQVPHNAFSFTNTCFMGVFGLLKEETSYFILVIVIINAVDRYT